MNDEIKEILDKIKQRLQLALKCKDSELQCTFEAYEVEDMIKNIDNLLDYITNLQQENKKLKEIVENLTTMTVCGDNKQIKNTAQCKLDIYKSRIDKAIEHIEKHQFIFVSQYGDESNFDNHLLDILKGDDKNGN